MKIQEVQRIVQEFPKNESCDVLTVKKGILFQRGIKGGKHHKLSNTTKKSSKKSSCSDSAVDRCFGIVSFRSVRNDEGWPCVGFGTTFIKDLPNNTL